MIDPGRFNVAQVIAQKIGARLKSKVDRGRWGGKTRPTRNRPGLNTRL